MKTKTLLLLTVILSLCIIQIKAFDDVDIFNPFDDDAKLERCMSKKVINRIKGTINTDLAGHGVKGHCRICRADKDDYGVNISSSEAQTGEDAKGTYAIRPKEKKENAQLICQDKLNEDQAQVKYDQENKIPRCEMYDHYGLCVRCMIGYGLQWNDSAVGTGEQTGAYRCIDNQYRTPYCHKYNSSNKCIECKWNQDPEQKYIYQNGDNTDQTYRLDFALYEEDGKTYCVNNELVDPQLKEGSELVQGKLTPNCASYDSSQKCTRCHTRKFNLEGIKQYNDIHIDIEDDQDEKYKKPILDFHLNQQNKPECNALPSWFKTDPSQLKKWNTNWDEVSTNDAECITGDLLKGGSLIYGCGTSVSDCSTYAFDWDLDHFQKEGVWVKKITGCAKCENTHILDSSDQTCKKQSDYTNCSQVDASGCTVCNQGYILKKNNGSIQNGCISNDNDDEKCMAQHYDNNEVKRCTRCIPGYVIKDNGSGKPDTCEKITQYIEIKNTNGDSQDPVRYELYERGCLKINIENKCIEDGGYGYTKKQSNKSSGRCKNGLMYDQMLCKTDDTQIDVSNKIEGCEEYVTVYEETRCIKCSVGHLINYSGSRCHKIDDSITVPNCAIQDGPWCQRCKRDDTDAENPVYYELTQYNTCVKIDTNATDEEKQCLYRNYIINNNKQLSPGNCLLCTDKYFVNSNTNECELHKQYKTQKDDEGKIKVPVLTTSNKTGETNSKQWDYLYDERKVPGCRIYTDDKDGQGDLQGNCFECDRVENNLFAAVLNQSGTQYICQKCGENQILKEDSSGHIICADKDNDNHNFTGNCLDTGDCEICQFGYEVDYKIDNTKQCLQQISYGCFELNYYTDASSKQKEECKSCQHPFYLNEVNKCQFIIPNCITISGKKCTQCDPGYEFDVDDNKCYRKSDLCKTQDWNISKDPNSNLPRAHVCKTCFNINSSTDYIRLFMKDGTLRQGCMSGCEDQQLYRYMNTRSDSNPFNVWTCNECRNDHYHYLNTESRKNCQPAQVITNCAQYVNETTDGTSKCRECEQEYSLGEQGTQCNTCQKTVTNCDEYDYTQSGVGEGNNKICTCKICIDGSTPNNNECQSPQTNIPNCKVYSSTECSECNQGFFLKDKKCSGHTVSNCLTYSQTSDECLTCGENQEISDKKDCQQITAIINCKTHESKTLCLECDAGFGLNFERTSCLDNSKDNRSEKCFQYSNNNVKESYDNNTYPVCIKCYEDFALDYNHNDIKKQCVNAQLCQRARFDSGNHITEEQTCQECFKVDKSGNLVYRTEKGTGGKCRTTSGTHDIDNCRVYNTYQSDSANTCYDCHEGYSPDSKESDISGENSSTICVSDYHPGSLPGCLFYDEANGNGLNWLKYEWLKCKTCEIEWRFHSASSEIPRKRYNANTYTRDCDVVEQVNLATIAPNVWTGKDGGLRSSQTTGDDDDDGPVIIPDDREQYEDPIVFANILSFSAILILAIISVL